jgi:hypothetical protein
MIESVPFPNRAKSATWPAANYHIDLATHCGAVQFPDVCMDGTFMEKTLYKEIVDRPNTCRLDFAVSALGLAYTPQTV